MHPILRLALGSLVLLCCSAIIARPQDARVQRALDNLLAADRAFSAASATADLVSGLSAMFAEDVIMPTPPGRFADGRAQAIEALRSNPDNQGSRIEWTPIRGGISADGQHGFTFGFMRWHQRDGRVLPLKYLSYWVKGGDGWRVAAYKRGRITAGDPPLTPMPPSLPQRLVDPVSDPGVLASHRASLEHAEREFSREAQLIGIGPAFAKYGRPDAVNMGSPDQATFTVGADAIAHSVSAGAEPGTSPVSWGPEKVLVASSGDLGVSIGTIRRNAPPSDPKEPTAFPFFTVWRRDNPTAPWRYIAE